MGHDVALVGVTRGGRETEGLVRHLTPAVEGALTGHLASGGEALHRLGGEEVGLRGELDPLELGFLRETLGRLGSWTETILCTRHYFILSCARCALTIVIDLYNPG